MQFSGPKSLLPRKLSLASFLIILVVVDLFVVLGAARLSHNHPVTQTERKSAEEVPYFSVVKVTPADLSNNNPEDTAIKITFSEPVRPDNLRNYFTVSPMIPGDFSAGASPNEVVFKTKYPFGRGVSVKVIINKGLESIAGNKFTADYSYNFYTKILDNSVLFESKNFYSRWANLSIGQSLTFNLRVGSDVSSKGAITVYKGTLETILTSLTYKNTSFADTNYVDQNYLNLPVDTSKMTKVYTSAGLKDGNTFDFNQNEGLYYIQATSNNEVVGSTWVNITDQGLIARQDDQNITIASQNIKTGETASNVKVSLYNLEDTPTLIQSQDMTNFTVIPVAYPQRIDLVVGQTEHGLILVPLTVPETQADIRVTSNLASLDKIYLTVDRPTYVTDDTVKFSGLVRRDNDAKYTLPPNGEKIRLWLADPADDEKKLVDQTVEVDSNGVFSGEFNIPSTLGLTNNATLFAKGVAANAKYVTSRYYTTFDVVDQSAKELLVVTFDKPSFTRNEGLVAHIRGVSETGQPLANQTVEYTVYTKNFYENDPGSLATFGNEWGEPSQLIDQSVKLDSSGKADVNVSLDPTSTSEAVTFEVSSKLGPNQLFGAKTVLVHQGNFAWNFGPSRQSYYSGEDVLARVYAQSMTTASVSNLSFNYQIYKSQYDDASRSYKETILKEDSSQTDPDGFALIKAPLTAEPGSYSLRVIATDSLGNKVQAERPINVKDNNGNQSNLYYHDVSLDNLDIATDKPSYKVGDTAYLVINSPFDQNVFVTYESGRIYHNEWLKLNKGDNNYQVAINSDLYPSFNLVFSYFHGQSLFTEGLPFTVTDAAKNLNIAVSLDKTTYAANDSAVITVTTTGNGGQALPAAVALNLVDENIFNLRDNMPSGDLDWFLYSPRLLGTNFSASTLGIGTGGGCGGGSGVDIKYVPNRTGSTVYWNPNLVTNEEGKLTITVPLASASQNLRLLVTAATRDSVVGQARSQIQIQ